MKLTKQRFSSNCKLLRCWSLSWILMMAINISFANNNINNTVKLQDITVKNLSGDNVVITLKFSDLPRIPAEFTMDSPPELVFDFMDTINDLPRSKMFQKLSLNLIKNISFANSGNKVRMVVSLNNSVPYTSEINGNNLILTVKNEEYKATQNQTDDYSISALDFHRGEHGEGKLILDVKSNVMNIDVTEEDSNMVVEFKNATISNNLLRKFDVGDFGTPIKTITLKQTDNSVFVTIIASGEYEKISYHTGDKYIVEARPQTILQQQIEKARKFKFTGEKISLNFQDIEIRAVLQLLADFTGMNIVANDSVQGNVTLRLDNIPWDQALDFILKSKGLAKRESGNVVLIAPSEELSKYEEIELSSVKQLEALSPLKTEFLQINYAKAEDVVKMVQGSSGGKDDKNSMLSSRGTISVDARTNTLLIKDIDEKISDIRDLIKTLDIPVKQVLIEAYIVEASENFQDALGIKLNGAATAKIGSHRLGLGAAPASGASGSSPAATTVASSGTTVNVTSTANAAAPAPAAAATPTASTAGDAAWNIATSGIGAATAGKLFDFGTSAAGVIGIALSRLPGGTLLNMELDAGEVESLGTVISKPRILTMDKQAASIESGTDIPYTTSTANSGSSTTFQKAVLKLQVTPQITPNDQISMDLSINNDSPGTATAGASGPPISTTSLKTNVLVNNGETIILGGLFKDNLQDAKNKIPYLSDLPFLGKLFQNKKITSVKSELLVFITPRIIKSLDKEQR